MDSCERFSLDPRNDSGIVPDEPADARGAPTIEEDMKATSQVGKLKSSVIEEEDDGESVDTEGTSDTDGTTGSWTGGYWDNLADEDAQDGEDVSDAAQDGEDVSDADVGAAQASRKSEAGGELSKDERERKAVKSDDAPIPKDLWTKHCLEDIMLNGETFPEVEPEQLERVMEPLRERGIRWWKRRTTGSYWDWLAERHSIVRNRCHGCVVYDGTGYVWGQEGRTAYKTWWAEIESRASVDNAAARDALKRAANSSWWEWDDGSRPFHWRWPTEYQEVIRDGLRIFVGPGETSLSPQDDTRDAAQKAAMVKKLRKVRDRGYITKAEVKSLTNFFPVLKGLFDIRMVYDGTRSGLNDRVWVPHFALASLKSALRCIELGSFMGDIDIGEMFLNFILHETLVPLCGVDLSHYFPDEIPEGLKHLHEAWSRTGMGFKWSPYQAVQAVMYAEEVIAGDHLDPLNVFRWDRVRLNLPGSEAYDPSLPWVSKIRDDDGKIAADFKTFVDDNRHSGSSSQQCWSAGRRVASGLNHLGIQDAARKRRDASQTPGAWAGCVIWTRPDGVFVMVSEDKWTKAKAQLGLVETMMTEDSDKLELEVLLSVRGFLQYVAATYPSMKPYMIGFHQTIDGWRPNRNADGVKLPLKKGIYRRRNPAPNQLFGTENIPRGGGTDDGTTHGPAPKYVKAVPRFSHDLAALRLLMKFDKAPMRKVRCDKTAMILYGFGDASGPGYGSMTQGFVADQTDASLSDLHYEYGQWRIKEREEESSNWRELGNLVEALEEEGRKGRLNGVECFIGTDNSVAESAVGKGYSQSPKLSDLALRMYLLEMKYGMTLHLIHVSGKRMIDTGGDGLSRGDKSSGAMLGIDIRKFFPLNHSATERSSQLEGWTRDLARDLKGIVMTPEDWFRPPPKGCKTFVWLPPPAAADVVMEQMSFARQKRPWAMHIILVPRLMTREWRKRMIRATDFYTTVDNTTLWPMKVHHEPLLMFVALPFVVHRPEFAARKKLLGRLQRSLRGSGVSQVDSERGRAGLCELLSEAWQLYGL